MGGKAAEEHGVEGSQDLSVSTRMQHLENKLPFVPG